MNFLVSPSTNSSSIGHGGFGLSGGVASDEPTLNSSRWMPLTKSTI